MSWINDILKIKSILPQYWDAYESQFRVAPDSGQLIRDIGFAVIDTETTGLNQKEDVIISIAAVKLRNYRITVKDTLEIRVKQDNWKGNESVGIHEIMPSSLEDGLYEAEAVVELLNFFGSNVLVAHHAAFDVNMINKMLSASIGKQLLNKSIDTAQLATRLEMGRLANSGLPKEAPGLDVLCNKYGIEIFERHTAAGDAFATAMLLIHLLKALEKRGIKTRGDLGV